MAYAPILNMAAALEKRLVPTITLWNRLEGRPRTDNFARALKAEVRDPLWMVARQWQMGEFQGDDAGSPIFAKLHLTRTTLTKYRAGDGPVEAFGDTLPLEVKVEQRPLAFRRGGTDVSLDLRLVMGRQWLKLMAPLGGFAADFLARYPVHAPDDAKPEDAPICAHAESFGTFAAASGRRMDGYKLYEHLVADPTHHAHDGIPGLAGQEAAVEGLEARFLAWFRRQFHQPDAAGEDAWEGDRLEYRFSCAAPRAGAEMVLRASEYYHGHLDWYALDIDPEAGSLGDAVPPIAPTLPPDTQTVLPAPVAFQGMPNTRWWEFEDRRTNFGDVKPDTTDIGKLLLLEFALVYANDWFMIPYRLPVGAVSRIAGMAVTNVFGERTLVEAAGRGPDDAWQRWAMFNLETMGEGGEADTSLVLLPTAMMVQEGKPLEEVLLVRDEVANMVWGVERTVPLPSGAGKPGAEAARELRGWHERHAGPVAPPPPALPNAARVAYEVMATVPEHWIPFVPVHVPGDSREIQLQRASMPRILGPGNIAKVKPRTGLLRQGLDQAPVGIYVLHEEEVPRAGVRVTQGFQRTRWRDGRVYTWLGVRKQTGRGEASSGLAFDRIADI